MNVELKHFVDIAITLYEEEKDLTSKHYWDAFVDTFGLITELPSAIENFGELQAEIINLEGSPQQADLIAHIESRFAGVGTIRAQNILNIILKIVSSLLSIIVNCIQLKDVAKGIK